jgi:hypothetical protein
LPPDFVVNADGDTVGQGFVLDTRLRLGVTVDAMGFQLRAEGDAFTGQVAGDTWDLGETPDERRRHQMGVFNTESFSPRVLAMSRQTPLGKIDAGLMTSHWGLGMVANDGAHDPYFGRNDGADVVLRAKATTTPVPDKPIYLILAADRVYADDVGSWAADQEIYQLLFATLYKGSGGTSAGVYTVYRQQTEADGVRQTDVSVVDLYLDHRGEIGVTQYRAAMEAAWIDGSTTRGASYQSPEGLTVSQLGATGLFEVDYADWAVGLTLRGGIASGDGDGYDDSSNGYNFDQNFDVGLVMFDEVGGALAVSAWNQVSDLENVGQAPDGAESLVNEGALSQAAFTQPILRWAVRPGLDAKIGVLAAWATAPIASPFYSGRNGGVPTTHLDQASTESRALGVELDWALNIDSAELGLSLPLAPALLLQGGHYFPGENIGAERLDFLSASATLDW